MNSAKVSLKPLGELLVSSWGFSSRISSISRPNSTLIFAFYLLWTQLKDLAFIGGLGSSWEILSLLLPPQHGVNQPGAVSPETRSRCSLSWISEGILLWMFLASLYDPVTIYYLGFREGRLFCCVTSKCIFLRSRAIKVYMDLLSYLQ